MTNEYIIDYKDKSYLTIWWGSEDGGIIYTAEFQCYFVEEGVYEALVISRPYAKNERQFQLANQKIKCISNHGFSQ